MRVELVHRELPRPRQQANCLEPEDVGVPDSVGTKPLFEARGTGATLGSERHFYPSLSWDLGSRLHAVFQRVTMAFSRGLGRSIQHWILEPSNILAGMKKALHLCKALIYLVFLAPRPGLEPGTYGLTAPPPNGPPTRANARFPGFCCLIFSPSFDQLHPGSARFGGQISDSSRSAEAGRSRHAEG